MLSPLWIKSVIKYRGRGHEISVAQGLGDRCALTRKFSQYKKGGANKKVAE